MTEHEVRTYPSSARLPRQEQLAWKLAAVATDPADVPAEVAEMVVNRLIDDAAVAAAALARAPVRAAREQALRHPAMPGAAVWGAAPEVRVLHEHKIDHIAHLGPSAAAGLGALLELDTEVVYQAIGQALHCTTQTRQSRKGEISSWKAYAPAFAGKVAVEAVDRAMRGQGSPAPVYEGEDGVIAWLLITGAANRSHSLR